MRPHQRPSGMPADGLPLMRELLERGGFRVRSATRADCTRCQGRSHSTVSYTSELVHCFRCRWAANRIALARKLGLLSADLETQRKLRQEGRHSRAIESTLTAFECWRNARMREITDRYRVLGRQAALARQVLSRWPECDLAWCALARLSHTEAKLCAALDWLTFARASMWLEFDSTPREVFCIWRATRVAA